MKSNRRNFFKLTSLAGLSVAGGSFLKVLTAKQEKLNGSNRSYPQGQAEAASKWTIGIYTGPSPFQLTSPENVSNPVLTGKDVNDQKVDWLAHPFMVVTDSMYYVFFTAKDHKTDQGGIGMAESKNGFEWKYKHIVIDESFVLAYPYVFKWQNDYYMIPEGWTENSVRLYKAVKFPDTWKYQGDLLTGDQFISTTLFRHKDMWWIFTTRTGGEILRLFYASDLMGKWIEHPQSPVIEKDKNIARPGGRPFIFEGSLYRLGQGGVPTYGYQLHAFQITDISTTTYKEKMIETPIVKASGKGWNAEAMHHADVYQIAPKKWIAVVDALGK